MIKRDTEDVKKAQIKVLEIKSTLDGISTN